MDRHTRSLSQIFHLLTYGSPLHGILLCGPILQYRRLGNGAAFYGKRKSNFYGEQDKNRKTDREQDDPTEDYQGPSNAGYFQWAPDEDGQMRPVTRMKNQIVERNPKYWDRVYEKEDE